MGDWLGLTAEAEAQPNDLQAAFLAEARGLLDRLKPVRASNTWAALLGEGLILVIPLDRAAGSPRKPASLHSSVQLMMREWNRGPGIVGDWHDAHYAWDYEPKNPGFSVAGHGPDSRSHALAWLTTQLERSVVRDEWAAFGLTTAAAWRHADGGRNFVNEIRGLFPIALLLRGHPTRSVPAGFFDPW